MAIPIFEFMASQLGVDSFSILVGTLLLTVVYGLKKILSK